MAQQEENGNRNAATARIAVDVIQLFCPEAIFTGLK
jgi:hypothetical protein